MEKTIKELICCFDDLPDSKGIFVSKLIKKYGNHEIYSMLKTMLLSNKIAEFDASFILLNYIYNNLGFIPGDDDIQLVDYFNKNHLVENTYKYYLEKESFVHLFSIYSISENLPIPLEHDTIIDLISNFSHTNPLLLKPLFERLITFNNENFPFDIYKKLTFTTTEIELVTKFDIASSWKIDPFVRDSLFNELIPICPEKYLYSLKCIIENNKLLLSNDFDIDDTGNKDPEAYLLEKIVLDYYTANAEAYVNDQIISLTDFLQEKCD